MDKNVSSFVFVGKKNYWSIKTTEPIPCLNTGVRMQNTVRKLLLKYTWNKN